MASLTAKKIGNRTYYYLRECRRVDGRPKIVRQIYPSVADSRLFPAGQAARRKLRRYRSN